MNETFKRKEAERLGGMIASYAEDIRASRGRLDAIDEEVAALEAEKRDLGEAAAYYESQIDALERQRAALLSNAPVTEPAEKKPRGRKPKADEPAPAETAPAATEAASEEAPAAVATPEPKNDLPFPDPAGGPVPEGPEGGDAEADGGDLFGNMSL